MTSVNEICEFIWSMLIKGAKLDEIIIALAKKCVIVENEISDDIHSFIMYLKEVNIVK